MERGGGVLSGVRPVGVLRSPERPWERAGMQLDPALLHSEGAGLKNPCCLNLSCGFSSFERKNGTLSIA